MQQRQLRLGDILDDYCPRERRLANHTIVAMVGDDIRLTRCTTCDTEHPYKGGKVPRLRKKKTSVEAAYDEVLESVKQDMPPQGVLVTHPEPEEPRTSGERVERAGHAAGRARAQRQRQRARADGARRSPSAPAADSRAAAAHRARAGRASGARIHHPPGEQAPGTIPEQQSRPGRFAKSGGRQRRPWRQFARPCGRPGWASRAAGRRGPAVADALGGGRPRAARRPAQALAIVFRFADSRIRIAIDQTRDPIDA